MSSKTGRLSKCPDCKGKGIIPVAPQEGSLTTVQIGVGEKKQDVPSRWIKSVESIQIKCGCYWSQTMRQKVKIAGSLGSIPGDCPSCQNTGKILVESSLWAKVEPFLPGSWQQVLKYIKHQRDEDITARIFKLVSKGVSPENAYAQAERQTQWIVPQDYKTGRETTGEAELRRLANKTSDQVLPLVLDYREIAKLRGTYVEGWKPSEVKEYAEQQSISSVVSNGENDGVSLERRDLSGDFQGSNICAGAGMVEMGRTESNSITPSVAAIEGVRRIGRVHPSFGFKPATGQTSSENPNGQNYPSHSILAQSMKNMIACQPGNILINFDYKSFHVLTLGFEAQDPLYMRMARNDMHSFFALCGLLQLEPPEKILELPDQELSLKLKWYRKQSTIFPQFGGWTFDQIRNEKAKRAILGIGFGQGARSLFMLNPESYTSASESQMVLDMLDRIFPIPARWRRSIMDLADRQKCLVSRHGFVRRFWDVFSWRPAPGNYELRRGDQVQIGRDGKRWLVKQGDDAEACIAFLPANDAFGTIRASMIRIEERGLGEKFGMINTIHDSLVFDCPKRWEEECLWTIREEMERPNPYLVDAKVAPEGLSCQVEAKLGPSLSELKEFSYELRKM